VNETAADAPLALQMSGICKSFPGVMALDDVSLDVRRGEVHVLLGENGAGKSTLMKILSGALARDAGEIHLDGQAVDITGPGQAHTLGIRIIYQELNLIPQLSVAENIALGHEPGRFGLIDRGAVAAEAERRLSSLGVHIDPATPVRELGIAQQQMVEVAKALGGEPRVLIMDEPTSALTTSEIDQLFATISRLTARGVAVVYISHRMEEVTRVGHRVTVLRDGRYVATRRLDEVTVPELVKLMAGRELTDHYPRRRTPAGEEILRVESVSRRGVLQDVSFTLRRGEVLGVAGLLGAGRTELARVIAGADRPDSGRVFLHGRAMAARGPAEAIRLGVALLPEDRKTQGLVLGLPVQANLALPSARHLSHLGVVDGTREATLAQRQVDALHIRTPSLGQRVGNLSGGNQQKVVLGKWLAAEVDVLLMDEPTRGIDVAAKVEIYELMNRLTAEGKAILMISSELPEVLGMSDRILVLHRGRLVKEFDAEQASQEQVLAAALGQASPQLGVGAWGT
jgi:ribose transport system ATP-binding protein